MTCLSATAGALRYRLKAVMKPEKKRTGAILIGLTLFAIIPFTRLVHAFSAPFHYLFRPYIVYRRRDASPARSATVKGRGWDPVGMRDNEKTRR